MVKTKRAVLRSSEDLIDVLARLEGSSDPDAMVAIRELRPVLKRSTGAVISTPEQWSLLYEPIREFLGELGYRVVYGLDQWADLWEMLRDPKDRPDRGFDLALQIQSDVFSAEQLLDIKAMGQLVEEIVIRDVPDVHYRGKRVIDDLEVQLIVGPLDSAALAQCAVLAARRSPKSSTGLYLWKQPLKARITVNESYHDALSANGIFDDIILHELIHALGFDGNLLKQNMRIGDDYVFGGTHASQALQWAVNALPAHNRQAITDSPGYTGHLYIDNGDSTTSHWAFGFYQQKQPFFPEERSLPADQPFLSRDLVSGQLIRAKRVSGELMTALTPGRKQLFVQPWLSWPTIAALEDLGYQTIFGEQAKLAPDDPKAHLVAIDVIQPGAVIQDLFF